MSKLSHIDENNRPTMVDVSDKKVTDREACARTIVHLPEAVSAEIDGDEIQSKKGPCPGMDTIPQDLDMTGCTMTAETIAKALGGRKAGNGWMARCLAHDDREPSLSLRDGVDGEPVFNCFAGCDWRDIKDVLRARGLLAESGKSPAWQPRRHRMPAALKSRPVDVDQQQRIEFARRKWHEAIRYLWCDEQRHFEECELNDGEAPDDHVFRHQRPHER